MRQTGGTRQIMRGEIISVFAFSKLFIITCIGQNWESEKRKTSDQICRSDTNPGQINKLSYQDHLKGK